MRVLLLLAPTLLAGCAGEDTGKDAPGTSAAADTVPPTVTLDAPLDGAAVSSTIAFAATATDDVGVVEVSFTVNGAVVATADVEPWSAVWDATGLAEGAYEVGAIASDAAGNAAEAGVSVVVDHDLPPSVVLTAPAPDAHAYGTIELAAEASDDVGVIDVQMFIDNNLFVDDGSVPYRADWPSDTFAEGPHVVKAMAYDTAGQSGETSVTVTLDRTAPVVELDEPAPGRVQGTVTVSGQVEEALGLASVVLFVDGVAEASLGEGPYTYEWDTTVLAQGAHTLELVATDRAGHVGVDVLEVDVDNPPEVTITAPIGGDLVAGTVTVAATASDDGTVEAASLLVDGVLHGQDTREPWSWTWDTCAAGPGAHTLEVIATDDGGNTATDAVSVTTDRGVEVALLNPSGTLPATEILAAYASSDEDIVEVEWDLDGTVLATMTVPAPETLDELGVNIYGACTLGCADDCAYYEAALDVTTLPEGTHTLRATATDASGDTGTDTVSVTVDYDQDGDGHAAVVFGGDDCDDGDAALSPSEPEVCDGRDQDCDGAVDEEFDADGDGAVYGSDCPTLDPDCDDADATAYPGASERCDGADDDCDGEVDEDPVDGGTWYADVDGDGYGNGSGVTACSEPSGHATVGGDCDDTDATTHPGASEACDGEDDDCDGVVDEGTDSDGDGWSECDDCDDSDPAANPGAAEVCDDDVDEDCDGHAPLCRTESRIELRSATGYGAKLVGETTGDGAGERVAIVPDVDGDGYDDLAIGAEDADHASVNAGAVYFVSGPVTADLDLSAADARIDGDFAYAAVGRPVGLGDFDGDGLGDLLVPSYFDDTSGSDAGAAWVLPGPVSSGSLDTSAGFRLLGEERGDNAGIYAAAAGDVNGDGLGDALVGAIDDADGGISEGTVYLVCGPRSADLSLSLADATLVGEDADDQAARAAAAGDLDGDGFGDILVGSYYDDDGGSNAGAAYVIYGPVSGTLDLALADAKLIGEDANDNAGAGVASAGDVDGDGYVDILVADNTDATGGRDNGETYLVAGPVTADLDLSAARGKIGYGGGWGTGDHAAGVDLDGDGYADTVVGNTTGDLGATDAGEAMVFYGPWSGTLGSGDMDLRVWGEGSGDYLGTLSVGGDLDADGHPDLLLGAPGDDDGGNAAGAAFVVFSSSL